MENHGVYSQIIRGTAEAITPAINGTMNQSRWRFWIGVIKFQRMVISLPPPIIAPEIMERIINKVSHFLYSMGQQPALQLSV